MADQQKVQPKKTKTKKGYKYPNQPMMMPAGQQLMIYPYPMAPQQYQTPAIQQIGTNPQTGNPVIAVPVGPPVQVAQPMAPPVIMAPQPIVAPQPPVIVAQPAVPQAMPPVNSKPTVIIRKIYHKDDGCCSIFWSDDKLLKKLIINFIIYINWEFLISFNLFFFYFDNNLIFICFSLIIIKNVLTYYKIF